MSGAGGLAVLPVRATGATAGGLQPTTLKMGHPAVPLLTAATLAAFVCAATAPPSGGHPAGGAHPAAASGKPPIRRALAEGACGWERHPGKFMSDYAKHPDQMHHAEFGSLGEAQTDCIAIGVGCRGVTCSSETEESCTVRNHDHLRDSDSQEVTYVKVGCPEGFPAGSLDGAAPGSPEAAAGVLDSGEQAAGESRDGGGQAGGVGGGGSVGPSAAAVSMLPPPRPGFGWKDRQAPHRVNRHRET